LLILILLLLGAAVGQWTVLEIPSPVAHPHLPLRQRILVKLRQLNFLIFLNFRPLVFFYTKTWQCGRIFTFKVEPLTKDKVEQKEFSMAY
jgi:hypothetical protein